jgi:hypothetical protein
MVTVQVLRVVPQSMPAAFTPPPAGCWNVSVYGPPSGSVDGSPGVGEPADVPPDVFIEVVDGGAGGTAEKFAPQVFRPLSWSK